MRSRVVLIVVAVALPLAALAVVVTRSGGTHRPARLPILAAAGSGATTLGAAPPETALFPWGDVVYQRAASVPALDGSAKVYRISSTTGPDAARRLADALGLHGGLAKDESGSYLITDGDAQLTVNPNGQWGYSRQSSAGGDVVSSSPDTATSSPDTETTIPEHPADLPSKPEAQSIAVALLQRAGIDTNAAIAVDDGVTQWIVRVDPIIDGRGTEGLSSSVTVGVRGVVEYAYGLLGLPRAGDDYPVIGTPAAVDRLNRGEGFIGPRPLIATADSTPSTQEITLTGAEQILRFATSYDGSDNWLLPAYRFHSDQGDGPTVLAIDDSFLTPPDQVTKPTGSDGMVTIEPQPAPVPLPAPAPASSEGQ